jgi:8-oxo-dGTP diphosphatase
MVRAAGGAVWRMVPWGTEVVVVHRPAYGDWTLPKGKAMVGEADEETALREVREETGLECRLGPPLPSTTYRDADKKLKVVRYWAMTVSVGQAVSDLQPTQAGSNEVDQVRWASLDEARKLLTYPRDVVVLDALEAHFARRALP